MATIIEQLSRAKTYVNPAYQIACEIQEMQEAGCTWADVQAISKKIDAALSQGRNEDRAINNALAVLEEAEAIPAIIVPIGF